MKKKIIVLAVLVMSLLSCVYAYAKPDLINSTKRIDSVLITDINHMCIVETDYRLGAGYVEDYEDEYTMCVEYKEKSYELNIDRYTYEMYYDCEGMVIDGTIEILEYSDGSREYEVVSIK